ncbi:MAG: hypothetical protein IKO48_04540 [Elusimicrobia bacterium]|nr:hypothetical protein [Elusimicrobiota bacterium]
MYNFNYVEEVITKEKNKSIFLRLIKILNLIVHIGIIVIILLAVSKSSEIDNCNKKIDEIKNNIEKKRTINRIPETEKEWESRYYKLLAAKEQLENRTYYSSVLKDLGSFLPEGDSIINLSIEGNSAKIDLHVSGEEIKSLENYSDQASVLNSYFEKSEYINNKFVIETTEKYEINNKEVNAVKLKVDLKNKQ